MNSCTAQNLSSPKTELEAAHAIIENINDLQIMADQFEVIKEHVFRNDRAIGERLLFPAIAVPVERKSEFKCPLEYLEALKKMIPKVDKILVIGWRATEIHFLNLLSTNLQIESSQLKCWVVSESEESSKATIGNPQNAGVKAEYNSFDHGSSRFVRARIIRREF